MSVKESWADGDAYERYIGRWSRLVAEKFIAWLGAEAGQSWLDAACGTGALTETILEHAAPRDLTGVDASPAFVEHARTHVRNAQVKFEVADLAGLSFPAAWFDVVVSGLALNFMPNPPRVAAELVRVTKPGGRVGIYVWDYAGRMELLRVFFDAAVELDPAVAELDEGKRFLICKPEPLHALFEDARLNDVRVEAIDVTTRFRDFDDYWEPFLGGTGPAPTYVASLDKEHRDALREHIRRKLPVAPDGSIPLVARAWAVCGTK